MQSNTPPWRVLEGPGGDPLRPAEGERGTGVVSVPPRYAVVAIALAGVVVLTAFVVATQASRGAVEIRSASAAEPSDGPAGSVAPSLVVEVAGAVMRPGVYKLAAGARAGDAITAAGGYSPRVDAAAASRSLNLAAVLRDGEQVRIPSRDDAEVAVEGTSGPASGGGAGSRLNVNRATAAELETLPGIGPATAAKIVGARAERAFASVEELLERKLISSKVLEAIRSLVTTG